MLMSQGRRQIRSLHLDAPVCLTTVACFIDRSKRPVPSEPRLGIDSWMPIAYVVQYDEIPRLLEQARDYSVIDPIS